MLSFSNKSKIVLIIFLLAIGSDIILRVQFEYDKQEQESKYFNKSIDISLQRCSFSKWIFREGSSSYSNKSSNSLIIDIQNINNTSLNANGREINSVGMHLFDITDEKSFYIYVASDEGQVSGRYSFSSITEDSPTFNLENCKQKRIINLFPEKIGYTLRYAYYEFQVDIEILETNADVYFEGLRALKGEYRHLYPSANGYLTNGSNSFTYSGCCPTLTISGNSTKNYAEGRYLLTEVSDLNYYTNPIVFLLGAPLIQFLLAFTLILFAVPLFLIFFVLYAYNRQKKKNKYEK